MTLDRNQTGTEAAASGAYAGWSIPARVFSEGWIVIIGIKEKKCQPLRLTLSTQRAITQVIHSCNEILSYSFFPLDH